MSKVGKKIIIIPANINVAISDGVLQCKNNSASESLKILPYVKAEISEEKLIFSIDSDLKQAKANWGTMRALAQNVITGLDKGFFKALEFEGVGFRAAMEGENLVLNVGYSHPVKYVPSQGIKISVEKNVIRVSGMNKQVVGQAAAEIRAIKKPEPYKGKGIRYQGERIRRKAGKKTGTTK